MPLIHGSSREVISHNIREMMRAGHPQNQAVAAALHVAHHHARHLASGGSPVNASALPSYRPQTAAVTGTGLGQINPSGFVNTLQAGNYNLDPTTGALSPSTITALNAYAMRGLNPASSSGTTTTALDTTNPLNLPTATPGTTAVHDTGGGMAHGGYVHRAPGGPVNASALPSYTPQTASVTGAGLGQINPSGFVNTPQAGGFNLDPNTGALSASTINALNAYAMRGLNPLSSSGTTTTVSNPATAAGTPDAASGGAGNGAGGGGALGGGMASPGQSNVNTNSNTAAINAAVQAAIGQPLSQSAIGTVNNASNAGLGVANVNSPVGATFNGSTLDQSVIDAVNTNAAQTNPSNTSNINLDPSSTAGKIGGTIGSLAAGPIGGVIGWGIGTLGNAVLGSSSTPSTPTAANPTVANVGDVSSSPEAQAAAAGEAEMANAEANIENGAAGLKKGGQVNKRALGGIETASQMGDMAGRTRMMASGIDRIHPSGLVMSPVAGRSDHIPMGLGSNSYVIPADVISGIGQGNTIAGGHAFDAMLHKGPYGMKLPIPKISGTLPKPNAMPRVVAPHHYTRGGRTKGTVPTIVAGGERIVSPEEVARLSGGDYKKGHEMLDRWVLEARKHALKVTKKLPGPVGAKK